MSGVGREDTGPALRGRGPVWPRSDAGALMHELHGAGPHRWLRTVGSVLAVLVHGALFFPTGEVRWLIVSGLAMVHTAIVVPLTTRRYAPMQALVLDWIGVVAGVCIAGTVGPLHYWLPMFVCAVAIFLAGRQALVTMLVVVASAGLLTITEALGFQWVSVARGAELYPIVGMLVLAVLGFMMVLVIGTGVRRRDEELQSAQDATDRARADAERRAEEIRLLFNQAPIGITFQTRDGKFLYANQVFCEMVGMTEPEIIERGVLHRIVETDEDAVDRQLRNAFASNRSIDIEVSMRDGAGRTRRLVVAGRPAPLAGVSGFVMTVVDKTTMAEADQRSARFASALENTADLTVMFDIDGVISHANRRFAELFAGGRSPVGHNILDVAGQEFWDHLSVDRPSLVGVDGELRIRTADGRRVALSLLVTRSSDVVTGKPAFTAVARDVSDLVRARDELADLIQAKDRFIASVSHELRTPLTVVVGLASELARALDDFTSTDVSEFVAMIAQQSSEVAVLVEDLLTMARADAGTLSIAPEDVDLSEQITRALETVPAEVSDRVAVHGSAPEVWADPMRIRQIVRNLLTNAKKYGGPERRVVVGVEGGMARLSVADDGRPLSPSERRSVFAAYERVHDRAGTPDSLGLGLTISRRLARMMGGDVVYDHVDGWSLFSLLLPLASTAEQLRDEMLAERKDLLRVGGSSDPI